MTKLALELGFSEIVSKSKNYPAQVSAKAVLSKSTFQKQPDRRGQEGRNQLFKSPALLCTRISSCIVFEQGLFSEIPLKKKKSHN